MFVLFVYLLLMDLLRKVPVKPETQVRGSTDVREVRSSEEEVMTP